MFFVGLGTGKIKLICTSEIEPVSLSCLKTHTCQVEEDGDRELFVLLVSGKKNIDY